MTQHTQKEQSIVRQDTSFSTRLAVSSFVLFALFPLNAYAHPGHFSTIPGDNGFLAGLLHPLTGLDHMLAMIAVGLWAAQIGGRAIVLIPLAFVSIMAAAAAFGMGSRPWPFVEVAIITSVLILGLLVAFSLRLPTGVAAACAGLFAIFHGHAHGTELPASTSALIYGAGFITTTIVLHISGIALGLRLKTLSSKTAVRLAGGAIAVAGLFLFICA